MNSLTTELTLPDEYPELLGQLKARIRSARLRAGLAVNRELVLLYWHIGREILDRQEAAGWGGKVIDRLSDDLRREFPDAKGYSGRNLKYMRAFAEAWPDEAFVQAALAQITWYHNLTLIQKVKAQEERVWYVRQAAKHGWSRNVLVHQIDTGAFARQGRAITNFEATLPPAQSDLARQILKDPYNFDFLTVADDARERDVQRGLLAHLRDFMIELGVGFAFVGSNVHLNVADEDFYLDLLFYHLTLRCYVVIELKTGKFKPEYAGKMNFYLAAVDEIHRHADDRPSIGIILCREKNKLVVEYSLRDMDKPIGVPEYRLTESLPADLAPSLPTVEQFEHELAEMNARNDDGE